MSQVSFSIVQKGFAVKRSIMPRLVQWKNSKRRKPLLLRGARQVGKTWALMEFGRSCYENLAYFNLEQNPEYRQFFTVTKDPMRIIENLTAASAQPIFPDKTLLVFDEIQACPEAVSSLKYFCEDAPEYHVACAGSLLGLALAHPDSFPVGKVNVIDLHPMTFSEFLEANGDGELASYMCDVRDLSPILDAFFNPLVEKLRIYFLTGGMPEVVLTWIESKDVNALQEVLSDLLALYELDFQKHASATLFPKISLVWQSIPAQLARENKKFLYSAVRESARGREYEDAVQWLVNADLLTKVMRISKVGIPLTAYDEARAFKLYMLDVGLLRRFSSLAPSAITEGDRLFTEFKGALAENFILQELLPQTDVAPRYWAMDNPHYEVDFVTQVDNDIVPIEVKAGENVKAKSLRKYREKYLDATPLSIRFSLRNLSFDGSILNIPLFMAGQFERLVGIARAEQSAGLMSETSRPSKESLKAIRETEEIIASGHPGYDSVDSMFEAMNTEAH